MTDALYQGENFEARVDGTELAILRVWRRPDLTLAQGAELSQQMAEIVSMLLWEGHPVLLDVREAPTVVGPVTQRSLSDMIDTARDAKRRFAILVGHPMQELQLSRLVRQGGHAYAGVFDELESAETWLRSSPGGFTRESMRDFY